ncbi:MAG TPA: large conductance mechanosensitive channel protein MscL, partial [Arthrobacter sp.]
MLNGFRSFILKGNVVDLAVAVVIGAAFGGVVTALVQSVLMPFISALVGAPNFDSFAVVTLNGNDIMFGVLLTAIVNFLLVAAAIYFVVVVP